MGVSAFSQFPISAFSRIQSFKLSTSFFTVGSGRPFNLLVGTDTNNDSRLFNDRPALAGRNTGRGDPFYNFDIRLVRRFLVQERGYLELTFEAFNLFNHFNYNGINNVVGTACVTNFAPQSELSCDQRDSD